MENNKISLENKGLVNLSFQALKNNYKNLGLASLLLFSSGCANLFSYGKDVSCGYQHDGYSIIIKDLKHPDRMIVYPIGKPEQSVRIGYDD